MNETIYTGIDIGSKNIKIMSLSFNRETNKTKILYKNSFPSAGVSDGYISNSELFIQSFAESLKKCKKETSIDIKEAIFTIDSFGLKSKTIKIIHNTVNQHVISEIDIDEITRKINIIAKKNIPGEIIDSRLIKYKVNNYEYFSSVEELQSKKVEAEYIFIYAPANHISTLEKVATSQDISITGIVSGNIISGEINLEKEDKNLGVLNVDIGADKTSFSLWEDSKLIFLDSFNFGSDDITKKISLEKKISFSEAESLKRNFKDDKKIEKLIRLSSKEIVEKIKFILVELGKHELLPAGVVLFGGGAKNDIVRGEFKNILSLPVKKYSKNILDSDTDYHAVYAALIHQIMEEKNESLFTFKSFINPLKKIFSKIKLG